MKKASNLIQHATGCPDGSSAIRASRMSYELGARIRIAIKKTNTARLATIRRAAGAGASCILSWVNPKISQPKSKAAIASKVTLKIRQFRIGDVSEATRPIQIIASSANEIARSGLHPAREELRKNVIKSSNGRTTAATKTLHLDR